MTSTYLKKIFPMTWKRAYIIPTYQVSFDTSSQYITNTITPFNVEENTEALYLSTNPNAITIDSTDYAMQLSDDFIGISWWSANNIAMVSGTPISIISATEFEPTVVIVHKDTQWPCPNGFHIGKGSEWASLQRALTTLWLWNKTDFMTYLKVPSAYYLNRTNGAMNKNYWPVRFWTSTMNANTAAVCMYVNENDELKVANDKPGNAFSIRPFKNVPAVPDNSWTTLYQWTWSAWIFWNSTLWLISISWDWTTWTTMTDKNLWATNVWDDWLYYQFWNNHWFEVSPSNYRTSKVSNTQWYWPGNYYDDATYTRCSSWNGWFTDTNNNIWWGVTNWTRTE